MPTTHYENGEHYLVSSFEILEVVAHPTRHKILSYVAQKNRTFKDLIESTGLSKGGLSSALNLLSDCGLIKGVPFDEQVTHKLTDLGIFVYHCMNTCQNMITSFPIIKRKVVVLSSDVLISLLQKHPLDTFKYLLKGWKILLSPLNYEQIVEWLDEEIPSASCARARKLELIEDMIYNHEIFEISQEYAQTEKSIKAEFYLRKQKKLLQKQAELVATASDQDAIVVSSNNKTLTAARKLGLQAIEVRNLVDFLENQRLKAIGCTVIRPTGEVHKRSPTQGSVTYDIRARASKRFNIIDTQM